MIKRFFIFFLTITLFFSQSFADEGMWLLSLIGKNYEQMKAQGFKLTPDDIYNINHSSIKDAIGGLGNEQYPFGFFCSSEIVSGKGLVFTNHHCGFEAIQSHSTIEHDYLKNGFWAYKMDQELPVDGMTVSYLVSMKDVTDKVLAVLNDTMSEADRKTAIQEMSKKLEKEAKKGNDYGADVKPMFKGNQFFLFVYITYKDIRLVGAPPSAVGKFGGDTDNWMWPRHTGDFSIFRVYTGSDGNPAKFSKDNIPLKPKHALPVSLKGVEKGDFAMIMGYPGGTDRYLTSWGITQALDVTNPATVAIRDKKLAMMKEDMDTDPAIHIKYASKYAQTANYWKYFIGQSKALVQRNVLGQKQEIEKQFQNWVNQDENRKKKYETVLDDIADYYSKNEKHALSYTYLLEALLQGGEIIMFPAQLYQFERVLKNSSDNKDLINEMANEVKVKAREFYKDYNVSTDKKIFASLSQMYYNTIDEEYQPEIFKTVVKKKYKGNFQKFTEDLFKKSFFADSTRFMKFLDNPTAKALDNDMAFEMMQQVIKLYFSLSGSDDDKYTKAERLFMDGLMKMQPNKLFYPDANSTIRLTFGNVGDYLPRDAVHYSYFTTLKGVMEKEDPNNDEFIVPKRLKELYQQKDYGQYADADGTMHVCFTTNNDITGGNSGSVVMNGEGQVIGIAFDGNWEAMSGDISFDNEMQKCINVDIRYVLFMIDKYAGAHNLISEMNLVK
ncbi:MAG: S46 family peptidase [Bacteroidales bacterium]|nr:S46 family peptidase [Bacteroidales bacterium]